MHSCQNTPLAWKGPISIKDDENRRLPSRLLKLLVVMIGYHSYIMECVPQCGQWHTQANKCDKISKQVPKLWRFIFSEWTLDTLGKMCACGEGWSSGVQPGWTFFQAPQYLGPLGITRKLNKVIDNWQRGGGSLE